MLAKEVFGSSPGQFDRRGRSFVATVLVTVAVAVPPLVVLIRVTMLASGQTSIMFWDVAFFLSLAVTTIFAFELIRVFQSSLDPMPSPLDGWLRPVASLVEVSYLGVGDLRSWGNVRETSRLANLSRPIALDDVLSLRTSHGRPPEAASRATEVRYREHIVRRKESLWSIAKEHLGAGERWKEILDLNLALDHEVVEGRKFPADGRLEPSWSVLVPLDERGSPQ